MSIKEEFHQLIDSLSEDNLESYYNLILQLNELQTGKLWSELTDEQKSELIAAYEESFNEKNLLSHEYVKQQHKRWLDQ